MNIFSNYRNCRISRIVFRHFFHVFLVSLSLSSCVSTKQMTYFQGDTTSYVQLKIVKPPLEVITPNDILSISVGSLDDETSKIYGFISNSKVDYSGQAVNSTPLGYDVDSLGIVNMPIIGKIKLSGISTQVASDTIKSKLNAFIKDAFVNVKIVNHKFTILGEVSRPGTYNLVNNQISFIEGLGMAGDLTDFAKRDNIILIRHDSGKRVQVRLNLLSDKILTSPYYYLKNGDVIYVDVNKSKAWSSDAAVRTLPMVATLLSALSALTLIITRLQ